MQSCGRCHIAAPANEDQNPGYLQSNSVLSPVFTMSLSLESDSRGSGSLGGYYLGLWTVVVVRLRRRRRRRGEPGNIEPVLDDVRTIKRRCGLTKEREAPTVLQQESSQVP